MYRNNDVLRLAQGEKCLLEAHPYCSGAEGSTTVAAHSNQLIHGKGKGLKADDSMTVWACYKCHEWLDQGTMDKKAKAKLFDKAWKLQVEEWHKIAESLTIKPWRREAAINVLTHIGALHGKNR